MTSTRYYIKGIRIPRWLFVMLFGEPPRITINGRPLDGPRDEVRRL